MTLGQDKRREQRKRLVVLSFPFTKSSFMFISSFIYNGSVGLSYVCKWAFFTRKLIDYIRGMFSSPGSGQEQRLNAKGSNY